MTATVVCPKCGGSISATAPEGLCPHCLLASVFRAHPPAGFGKGPPPVPGSNPRIGDYDLLQQIGRGGMGVVYKARQLSLNRLVALKLMILGQLATEQAKQRVRNEAQAAAHLQHPNIVAVYNVGEHEGAPFIAMEYIAGDTLESIVRVQPLKPAEAAELLQVLAQAINYAHQQGVVHRDLKPSNIIIDANHQPRITDFGLAKHSEIDASLTLSGQALGTPSFMSPEQAGAKRREIGPSADIYSLGGVLYFVLLGRPPFVADSRDAIISQVLRAEPIPLRRLNTSIPKDLQTICLKCLDKNPHRRYQTAQDLADDLRRYLRREPIRARPTRLATSLWRWCQRQPLAAVLLAGLFFVSGLALLSLLIGFLVAATQWQRAEESAIEQTRLRQLADQSAAEQKRLREIAEEAVRNLKQAAAGSYQTSGVFRFKLPAGFTPINGEPLGVLSKAIKENLTLQESSTALANTTDLVKQRIKQGTHDYAKRSGLVPPDTKGGEMLAFYESPSGARGFGFMRIDHLEPTTPTEMERTTRTRVRWLADNDRSLEGSYTVSSGPFVAGRPTIMVTMLFPPRKARQYHVYIQGQPQHTYALWTIQNVTEQNETWIEDLLRSIDVISP